MVAQTRRLSWQVLLIIAIAAVVVTAILVAHFALTPMGGPHHVLNGLAASSPTANPVDGGFGH